MAKFPTEVESTMTVKSSLPDTYAFFWDVVGSSSCIEGLERCKSVGKDTYRFVFDERSTGPVSMVVQYTARYEGNGVDRISFEGVNAAGDNTEVHGTIRLQASGGKTKITLRQMLAPDTPVPRLLQGLLKSFVEKEATAAVKQYLANVKKQLDS